MTRGLCTGLFLFLTLAAWGLGPGPLGHQPLTAQDVSVRSFLNPTTVGVGRTFVLNVEVSGSQSLDSQPQPPDLDPFATYLGSGTSTSMQIVNGRTSVSLTIQFRYQALSEGTFEIPSVSVSAEGGSYSTEAQSLTISSAPPPDPQRSQERDEAGVIGPDDIFLTAEANRSRIREGEPFVVEYRIFTRVNVTSYGFTRLPESEGFWIEELPLPEQPQVEQVVRNGEQYTSAVIRRVALVPTGAGPRTLEPLGIEAQVRVRQQRTLDPFESIFDFDRSSLFGTVVPVTVASNPVEIEVEALPSGRPQPFSGVVGSLDLSAEVSLDSVAANEAVTLSVVATGEGNLRGVPEPTLQLPSDFEVYPPEVSESLQRSGAGLRGSKRWEYVFIPRAPGRRTIPSVSFGYFDTDSGVYRTASTEPLEILVSGELPEGPSALIRGGVTELREDIRFIHLAPSRWTRVGRSAFGGTGFWVVFLLPMAAILGALFFRLHQDRLESDPAYARRRRAGRVAHARLAEARRLASGASPRGFYAEVARSLRGFVADQLDASEAGMQTKDVEVGLMNQGVPEALVQEVSALLEHCDLQRFAPERGDAGEESRFLEKVSAVMTELKREMGR